MPLSLSGVAQGSSILLMQTTTGIPAIQQLAVVTLHTTSDEPRRTEVFHYSNRGLQLHL
jgi:hypothetical protein